MLDHTGILVRDYDASRAFYTQVLAPLGYELRVDFGVTCGFGVTSGYGISPDPAGDFWLVKGDEPTKGQHIAFSAEDRATVDAFYEAAMAAGAKDNGPPGPRPHYHDNYYGAFVIDLDGHNIEAVCHAPA